MKNQILKLAQIRAKEISQKEFFSDVSELPYKAIAKIHDLDLSQHAHKSIAKDYIIISMYLN